MWLLHLLVCRLLLLLLLQPLLGAALPSTWFDRARARLLDTVKP
jgi:hypothetical protein